MVPITTMMKNGDIIEILTSEGSKGPSRDWIKLVKTPSAKAKIIKFFKQENKEENIEKGKDLLEKEIKKTGLKPFEVLTTEGLTEMAEKYGANRKN